MQNLSLMERGSAETDLLDPVSQQIFTDKPEAALLLLPSTYILEVNPAAMRLFGRTKDQMEGLYSNQFLIADSARFSLPLEELLEAGHSIPPQSGYQVITSSGETIPVRITATRIGVASTPLFFWVELRQDESVAAPLSWARSFPDHPMLEALPNAVLVLDVEGKLQYLNPAFANLVGMSRDELLSRPMHYPFLFQADARQFLEVINSYSRANFPTGIPIQLRHRNGRNLDVMLQPMALKEGTERTSWIISVNDVSDLKRAEAAWRASEQRFRSLCACSPVGIFMASPEGLLTWTNARFQLIVGMTNEQSLGSGWVESLHPEDKALLPQRWQSFARSGRPFEATYRFQNDHKAIRWARGVTSPIKTDDGRTLGHVGLLEDITEQRHAEETRQQLEVQRQELLDRLQVLLQTMPVGCIVLDQRYCTTYWNRSAEGIFGFTPNEARGKPLFDLIFPRHTHAQVQEHFRALAAGESLVDLLLENQTKESRRISCQWSFSPLKTIEGQFFGLLCMAQDVTDRRRSEETIRESERRYRLLADYSTDMISRHDLQGAYLYASPAATRLIGYTPGELIGRSAFEFIHPDDRHLVEHNRVIQLDDTPSSEVTFRIVHKDGHAVWIEAISHLIRDPETGALLEFQVTSRDITQRKAAEEALRRSEGKFRALVEKSSDGFALIDENRVLRYVSPATKRILGYADSWLIGKNWTDFIHPEDLLEYDQKHPKGSMTKSGATARVQMRAQHCDSTWRDLEIIITNYLSDPDIASWVVNYRDITDQNRLEEQLRQSQKMEAIGKLAGGIAHDFNNILTAIIGSVTEVLKSDLETGSRSLLEIAEKSARRAAELTSQLLGFSRRTNLRLKPLSLKRTIDEALHILKVSLDPRIHIQVTSPTELWNVLADATQMTTVMVNLGINARDAMPRGGALKVELSNEDIGEEYTRQYLFSRPGEFVRLRVEDTGSGIPDSVMDRIFEPFFTTKPTGKGTGLGLAMVYGTVKAHDGWIVCQSEIGRGTRFDLFIPRTRQEMSPEEPPPAPVPKELEMPGPTKSVLLVDDEPAIRMLAKRVLEMKGYRILLAEDGVDALETFREMYAEIGLVILDLTMPRMSGQDTFKQMREIDPNVRVLFSSGYSADSLEESAHGAGFITKPYRPDELTKAVREVFAQFQPPE